MNAPMPHHRFPEIHSNDAATADWNSALYLKFERERTRAAQDLLSRLPDFGPKRIVDLGCGPGNSTALLALRFPHAEIVGLDTSENMLSVAQTRMASATFVKQDIVDWRPEAPVDLIFANAALHFAPNHHELMGKLVSFLAPGGLLAVQMPNILQEVSHALIRMVAADGPWASRLVPVAKTRALISSLDDYYSWLAPITQKFEIWQTTYVHPLDGPDAIVDWFEGSALRPFLELLDAKERGAFLAAYRAELDEAYPTQKDGKVLLLYPRLFFVAQR